MDFGLSDSDRATILRYLRQDPMHWLWEELVRDLLKHTDAQVVGTIGLRVRRLFGCTPRLEEFDEGELLHLASFIRYEAALVHQLAVHPAAKVPLPPAEEPKAVAAQPARPASEAEKAIVLRYLGRDPRYWYWEQMVEELLPQGNAAAISAASRELRRRYGKSPRREEFTEEEVARLVGCVRPGAEGASRRAEP